MVCLTKTLCKFLDAKIFIIFFIECVPPSLRFFSGNEQVDLAKKLQEDPLYAIKKKEMESKSKLLKNPVKLKKLQELVVSIVEKNN